MGSRALYEVTENGITTSYYSHWGANILTPPWRLMQAEELAQQEQCSNMTISEVLKHVGYNGDYVADIESGSNLVLEEISKVSADCMRKDLCNGYDIEAYIKLDIDSNKFEYHENPRMSYTNRQTRTITGRLDSLKSCAKRIIDSEPENASFEKVEQKLITAIVNEPRSLGNFESYKNKECYERYSYIPAEDCIEMRKMVYTPNSRDTFANIVNCKLRIADLISFSEGSNHSYSEFERKCIYNGTERYITSCEKPSDLYSEFCYSKDDFSRLANLDTDQKELCSYIDRSFKGDRCAKKLIDTLTPQIRAIDSTNCANSMEIKLSEYNTVSGCPFPIPQYNNYWGFYYRTERKIGIVISKTTQHDIEAAARNRLALDLSQQRDTIHLPYYYEGQSEINNELPKYIALAINLFVEQRQYDEQNTTKKIITAKLNGADLSINETIVKGDSYSADISEAAKLLNTGNGVKLGSLKTNNSLNDTLALVNLADTDKQQRSVMFINKSENICLSEEQINKIKADIGGAVQSRSRSASHTQQQEQQSRRRR